MSLPKTSAVREETTYRSLTFIGFFSLSQFYHKYIYILFSFQKVLFFIVTSISFDIFSHVFNTNKLSQICFLVSNNFVYCSASSLFWGLYCTSVTGIQTNTFLSS